jgi:hypothetical protein
MTQILAPRITVMLTGKLVSSLICPVLRTLLAPQATLRHQVQIMRAGSQTPIHCRLGFIPSPGTTIDIYGQPYEVSTVVVPLRTTQAGWEPTPTILWVDPY